MATSVHAHLRRSHAQSVVAAPKISLAQAKETPNAARWRKFRENGARQTHKHLKKSLPQR